MEHPLSRVGLTFFLLSGAAACAGRSPLLEPAPRDLAWVAPDSFRVVFETSRGPFVVMGHRAWSPLGADRFHFLVTHGYYDGARFFRVVPGFVVQWGLAADPKLSAVWANRDLPDEPVRQSNTRGRLSYARGGPNTRSVQVYVNLGDNARLDTLNTFGFPPFGEVTSGLSLVDSMYAEYSCRRGSQGTCPSQDSIQAKGEGYLARIHPLLDRIIRARVESEWRGSAKRERGSGGRD
ncbi:MAG: peptidylprolyl isomerase [Gemmatimonadales bacterium]|nr:peptidylprolyl isomerase [Gemmatimonadales bacterium]